MNPSRSASGRSGGDRTSKTPQPVRCPWATTELMIAYHDAEWGVPVHDDRTLFEFLTLEGAQAGLSWDTVLRKRDQYRKRFEQFDPQRVAAFKARDVASILKDPGVIRHRGKIESTISNAKCVLAVIAEHGSLAAYLWSFVGDRPIDKRRRTMGDVPAVSPESEAMSRALRKRGFRFVGPTTLYAFMQATGMVNDHLVQCVRYRAVEKMSRMP